MSKFCEVLLSVALLLLFQTDAFACLCKEGSLEYSFEKTTVIFSGEVVKLDLLQATVKVEKVWKGEPAKEIILRTGTIKSSDGTWLSLSCDFKYVLGEKYLIYADGFKDALKITPCSRSTSLSLADKEIRMLERLKQEAEIQRARKLERLKREAEEQKNEPFFIRGRHKP